jgi:hypothetical protein
MGSATPMWHAQKTVGPQPSPIVLAVVLVILFTFGLWFARFGEEIHPANPEPDAPHPTLN